MQICGLQKLTVIDFPGRPAATVFLCSCNFRCPWCYSKELVLPEEIEKQLKISEKEFFSFLKERKGMLEGVVICGGEPTIHKDLPNFIEKIKDLGYLVKLDTNGSNSDLLKNLIDKKLVDYVALDVKLPKERYQEVLGVNAKEIEESIKILKDEKIDYEFRTTVIPTVHTKEDIVKIAQWLAQPTRLRQGYGGQGKYYLQSFKPEKTIDPEFEKIKPYSEEYLKEIQESVAQFFEVCKAR